MFVLHELMQEDVLCNMRPTQAITIMGLTAVAVFGQPASTSVTFENASIKPNGSGGGKGMVVVESGALTGKNITVKQLILYGYDLQNYQILGPHWIETEKFNVTAQAKNSATTDQVRLMVQTLLADRLRLKAHHVMKELPVYWLVVGKNGPRLPELKEEDLLSGSRDGNSPFKPGTNTIFNRGELPVFAERLSRTLDCPVLDKTGIKGRFFFRLDWTGTTPGPSPALFLALQEQLGLELQEQQPNSVDILSIDSIKQIPAN
jgi:uncharacterized protein (TIGR03435 family)